MVSVRTFLLISAILLCNTPVCAQNRDHVGEAPGPWERTEAREDCDHFDVLRSPWFGDLHIHTSNSTDAVVFNTLNGPRDAYRFARGAEMGLAPFGPSGNPAHVIQLGRPLDFAAVTDHAEGFGVQSVCFQPGLSGYETATCQALRDAATSANPQAIEQVFVNFLLPANGTPPQLPEDVCGPGPEFANCASQNSVIWGDNRDAAEEYYDRSSACVFTTMVAYEWSGTPQGKNLHRNVIYKNDSVPDVAISYIDETTPQGLWSALDNGCESVSEQCEWLAIPHNPQLSGPEGLLFQPTGADGGPLTAAEAARRARKEPLVELFQHKGSSECRLGVDTTDEQCTFELVHRTRIRGPRNINGIFPRLGFVRNVLKEGLMQEENLAKNPFRLGFVGGTDTHNAAAGYVDEAAPYFGQSGVNDDIPARGQLDLKGAAQRGENNPGGMTVVYAEENSRDALFDGLKRRETYATSGPRHLVRFFAGDFDGPGYSCDEPDMVLKGYRDGVPMGATITTHDDEHDGPTFFVTALKDPGSPGLPGAPLQRVQIIKGWIDDNGTSQEKVFEVAGDPDNGASVDLDSCVPSGTGFDSLCAMWKDPEFDSRQRAFYYARVIENPTCRWSTFVCNAAAIDCSDPASVPAAYEACCDATYQKVVQERSATSPIWHLPEGIGRLVGEVQYDSESDRADQSDDSDSDSDQRRRLDTLDLRVEFGAGITFDVDLDDIHITVRDDDNILDALIPAGSLGANGKARRIGQLARVRLTQGEGGQARLRLRTRQIDLSSADRADHMVAVTLRIGDDYEADHTRLWTFDGSELATR